MEPKAKSNFRSKKRTMIAIVSGASSGIGREFAYQIDDKGYDEIWLIARRYDRLLEIKNKLKTPVRILVLDLLENDSFYEIGNELSKSEDKIGLLINSAGMGINDYFENISLIDDERMIGLNITAPTKLIKVSLDYMDENSIIINVASVSGFISQPKFASYAASKSYLISLSRALNREFGYKKIHVATLCPNPVDTEFGIQKDNKLKKYGREDIHKLVKKTLKKADKSDLITTHPASKFMLIISKIFPQSFIMWIEKIIGMY